MLRKNQEPLQAYSVPNARTAFPLAELAEALGLDSMQEARDFAAAHGLHSPSGDMDKVFSLTQRRRAFVG